MKHFHLCLECIRDINEILRVCFHAQTTKRCAEKQRRQVIDDRMRGFHQLDSCQNTGFKRQVATNVVILVVIKVLWGCKNYIRPGNTDSVNKRHPCLPVVKEHLIFISKPD